MLNVEARTVAIKDKQMLKLRLVHIQPVAFISVEICGVV